MKVGGRNYGFGHQFGWATREALKHYYGEGHFGTVKAHINRFNVFIQFLKPNGIRDARNVDLNVILDYGEYLNDLVADGELKVSYAQNLISSVNVSMNSLRGNSLLCVSPSELVGFRSHIRTDIPLYIDYEDVLCRAHQLDRLHELAVSAMVRLARSLGLRFRECSLLDAVSAIRRALKDGRIWLTRGTKGGRDRWIPIVGDWQLESLDFASEAQGRRKSLIQEGMNYRAWRNYAYGKLYSAGIKHFHDLRAAYACDRYLMETGSLAPVLLDEGHQSLSRDLDRNARLRVSQELGHNRIDILNSYIGSRKK